MKVKILMLSLVVGMLAASPAHAAYSFNRVTYAARFHSVDQSSLSSGPKAKLYATWSTRRQFAVKCR